MNYLNRNDIIEMMLGDNHFTASHIVRPIRGLTELREVYKLTHDCYVANGYSQSHPSQMLIHYPLYDHLSETAILVAVRQGKIIGSISYTLDGPNGFSLDDDFKEECQTIRQEGKAVAVVWRLVVDEAFRTDRSIVFSLIYEAIRQLKEAGVETALFSVNPKHEKVYQRMLGMAVAARKAETDGLQNAPAVLLRGEREVILGILAGKSDPAPSFTPIPLMLANSPY